MNIPNLDSLPDETDDNRSPIQFFEDGFREFSEGKYFEAHDTWEEFWQRLRGPDRRFLQALIHLAVGSYHYENGNHAGARSQWSKSAEKLQPYPDAHWGIDRNEWLVWIGVYLTQGSEAKFPPTLHFERARFPSKLIMASG